MSILSIWFLFQGGFEMKGKWLSFKFRDQEKNNVLFFKI